MEKLIALFDELDAAVASFQDARNAFTADDKSPKYGDFRDLRKAMQDLKVKAQAVRLQSSVVQKEVLK